MTLEPLIFSVGVFCHSATGVGKTPQALNFLPQLTPGVPGFRGCFHGYPDWNSSTSRCDFSFEVVIPNVECLCMYYVYAVSGKLAAVLELPVHSRSRLSPPSPLRRILLSHHLVPRSPPSPPLLCASTYCYSTFLWLLRANLIVALTNFRV